MKSTQVQYLLSLSVATVILSGCALPGSTISSDNRVASHQPILDGSQSFPVQMVGLVDVIYNRDDSQQYFEAGFLEFEEPLDSDVVFSMLKPETSSGCTYDPDASENDGPIVTPEYLVFSQPHKRVSAGDSLEVRFKGRRYAGMSYERDTVGDYYEGGRGGQLITFNALSLGEVLLKSSSLTLTIPGDVFPAFNNIAIPAEPKLVDLKVNNRNGLAADSTVSWSSPESESTLLRLFAGGSGRALDCILPDNGVFRPQASIRDRMGESVLHVVDAAREHIVFYREKDVLLAIAHRSWMSARMR